jgi:hypothetical protein
MMKMKKIKISLTLIVLMAFAFSCGVDPMKDDPLLMSSVKKGTLLALRGQQLQNIYYDGKNGDEFVPSIATASDTFEFDTEFLAEDPSTLASVDVYVVKKDGSRVKVQNVPSSQFTIKAGAPDYQDRPWATISVALPDILSALGLPTTFPLDAGTVNTLVTDYKFGINIESDINLTDGTVIAAGDIIAAGLYQSNQFYPAMRLVYAVINYCAFVDDWAGTYSATEVYSSSAYGPYEVTFTKTGNPGEYMMTNFWDCGAAGTAILQFSNSTGPYDQPVKFPVQTIASAGGCGTADVKAGSTGQYDQCTDRLKVNIDWNGSQWRYEFTKL